MPRNNAARLVDEDRDRPAPLLDRRRKLGDLLVAVGARVPRVGDKLGDRPAPTRSAGQEAVISSPDKMTIKEKKKTEPRSTKNRRAGVATSADQTYAEEQASLRQDQRLSISTACHIETNAWLTPRTSPPFARPVVKAAAVAAGANLPIPPRALARRRPVDVQPAFVGGRGPKQPHAPLRTSITMNCLVV